MGEADSGEVARRIAGPIALQFEGTLAIATLSRPPVNAIDEAWIARLHEILDTVQRAEGCAVLLIRSAERAFCGGADLALMRSRFSTAEGRARMVEFARSLQRVFARLETMPQVSVAEIGGAAFGGGLELALACDLRIAAHEAKLGLSEPRLGLLPGAGGTQRLTRIAGEATAKRLILRAEAVSGADAAVLGVVQWAAPAAELAARARAIADEVAALPAAAIAACKRCISAAVGHAADGYEMELEATGMLLASADTQARVRRFLDKQR
jgi:enoyl-CoA hydratase/carnithine racemase